MVRSSQAPSGPVADITNAAVPVVPSEKPTISAVTEASVLRPCVSAAAPRVMHHAMITTGTTEDKAATIARRRVSPLVPRTPAQVATGARTNEPSQSRVPNTGEHARSREPAFSTRAVATTPSTATPMIADQPAPRERPVTC